MNMTINIHATAGIVCTLLVSSVLASGQTRSYNYDFESDTLGIVSSNNPTYDYTTDDNSTTLSAGGTLALRGNGSTTDYEIVSISGSQFIRLQGGINTQTDDFGIYIGGLDFSDFASGLAKEVSFSFDLLGNSLVSSTDWEVNYTLASSLAGHSGFVDDAFTGNLVFDFANSGSAATTISGTFTVNDGEGSTIGGLFISGPRDASGNAALASGGGSLAIDNISVTVSAVPEPAAGGLVLSLGILSWVACRRRLQRA
jgi:hypothetical protein